jgi:flagellar basal-body rod protein FlgF
MIHGIQRLARDMKLRIFRQEVIASNLANATTPGFKAQRAFDSHLKDAIGTYTAFGQGPIEHTQRKLDLAIQGEGFFVIDTPSGERFTRCGSFTLTESGFLATHSGDLVMGTGGPIAISGQDLQISPDGRVIVDGDEAGALRIVYVPDPQALVREGNVYASGLAVHTEADMNRTEVIQGALERSNVSPIDEMVEMISLNRGFEADQKSITLQDESAKQLIERVGSTG